MDIKIDCKKIEIDGHDCDYKKISVSLEGIDTDVFDNRDVAELISIERMFEAHGEDSILEYIKKNYDWFDKEE